MLLRRNVTTANSNSNAAKLGRSGSGNSGNSGSYDSRFSRFASSPPKRTSSNSSGTSSSPRSSEERSGGEICSSISTWTLLLIAAILTALTYVFPESNNDVGPGGLAHKAYEAEQELEKEMFDWWQKEGHGPLAPKPSVDGVDLNDATLRMLQQPSKWVDGEKKLKSQLKVLADRQLLEKKDIGVPVLTRYLVDDDGEEIPAWVPSDYSDEQRDQWEKKVADKYVEMRKAEDEWEKQVKAKLEQNKHRG